MANTTVHQNEIVHTGTEGWLFLMGGSNNVTDFYTTSTKFTDRHTNSWTSLLERRSTVAKSMGIDYVHLIAPEKLTIYPEFFGQDLPFYDKAPALQLASATAKTGLRHHFVDVIPFFRSQKINYQLYWKTDTHWTPYGAISAYQLLCHQLRASQFAQLPNLGRRKATLALDLGNKLSPPVLETFEMLVLPVHATRTAVNPLVEFKLKAGLENEAGLHVGSAVAFENMNQRCDPRTVLVFGDSFSEYRSHLLTGLIAETFRSTHFVWSANVDWNYVERIKPNIIITELAERFMDVVPTDDIDLESFAAGRLRDVEKRVKTV